MIYPLIITEEDYLDKIDWKRVETIGFYLSLDAILEPKQIIKSLKQNLVLLNPNDESWEEVIFPICLKSKPYIPYFPTNIFPFNA